MSTLFITVTPPPKLSSKEDYHLDPASYAEAIQKKWADVIVDYSPGDFYTLRWRFDGLTATTGGLQADNQAVSFEAGEIDDLVDYILWFRSIIPDKVELFLFDDNLIFIFELHATVTAIELSQHFKQHGWQ